MRPLIRAAILKPVATSVGAVMLVLFGAIALFRIPVQLTPTLESPVLSVYTEWSGATPEEVERDILLRQEEQLENLENLVRMESVASQGSGVIQLTFPIGTELELALMRVANRLQQVRGMPLDAEEPVVSTDGSDSNSIAWFMLAPTEGGADPGRIAELGPLMMDIAQPRLERVSGVSRVRVFGARALEMQIEVDPARLAARRITMTELERALARDNRDWSAGDFSDGKRRKLVRTMGSYESPADLEQLVVALRDGAPVRLGEVARAKVGHAELKEAGFYLDAATIGVAVQKKPGTNVLDVMQGLRQAVGELNSDELRAHGVRLEQSYDETEYIGRAISLVRQSLLAGGLLAVGMLFFFLRSRSTTLLVSIAIPLSLLGTFGVLWITGRTLNVISLAGLAFAVGMVVDNSIVVIENIYRHRQMGKSRRRSALEGAFEVWGAVLAGTLTTIAVFLPIVFLEGEVGQLFRDLAVAISGAVAMSLVVAMTVIPSLSAKLLEVPETPTGRPSRADIRWGRRLSDGISHMIYRLCGGIRSRLILVLGGTAVAVLATWALTPPMEYLPTGNRNFVYGLVFAPVDYTVDEMIELREPFLERLRPLWEASSSEARDLPGAGLRSFYYVGLPGQAIFGLRARDPGRAGELVNEIQAISRELPAADAFAGQRSIFEKSTSKGRNIDIALTGHDIPTLMSLGREVLDRVAQVLPDAQARPSVTLEAGSPEVRIVPDRHRLAELGITPRDLGLAAGTAVDGAWVGRYIHLGREIDMKLVAPAGRPSLPRLDEVAVPTPGGELVGLGSVASWHETKTPSDIHRLDQRRSIQIHVVPEPGRPLEDAIEAIRTGVVAPMVESGRLDNGYAARLSGSFDSLTQTARSMGWIFALALLLTFLLMAGLFESFVYPFVIMWAVPLATLGGVLGLVVLGFVQPQGLDVITMLGFVILVGTVVNNAILLVHQALNHLQDDMNIRDAVTASARNRIRPIFMSVATSIFGMLPLVLFPGAGSELYRGLGSVIVGGLLVSTVLTLFLIPCLLSLILEWRQGALRHIRTRTGRRNEESSRLNITRPLDQGSGTFAAADPSGTIDL